MRAVVLSDEEKEILEAFDKGLLIRSENAEELKKDMVKAAKNTMKKTKNINIRLSEKDLLKVKAKAAETGIPYQTLLSSVIHQFVNS